MQRILFSRDVSEKKRLFVVIGKMEGWMVTSKFEKCSQGDSLTLSWMRGVGGGDCDLRPKFLRREGWHLYSHYLQFLCQKLASLTKSTIIYGDFLYFLNNFVPYLLHNSNPPYFFGKMKKYNLITTFSLPSSSPSPQHHLHKIMWLIFMMIQARLNNNNK